MESPNSSDIEVFDEMTRRARLETPPDIDVRLFVKAALLTQPGRQHEVDWMDLMVGIFSRSTVRMAVMACAIALLLTIPLSQGKANASTAEVDHVASFLLNGE